MKVQRCPQLLVQRLRIQEVPGWRDGITFGYSCISVEGEIGVERQRVLWARRGRGQGVGMEGREGEEKETLYGDGMAA